MAHESLIIQPNRINPAKPPTAQILGRAATITGPLFGVAIAKELWLVVWELVLRELVVARELVAVWLLVVV